MEFTYRIIDFPVSSGHLTKDDFLYHSETRVKRWALCRKNPDLYNFSKIFLHSHLGLAVCFIFLLQPSAPGFFVVVVVDCCSVFFLINLFFLILKSLILTCDPKHEPPSHLLPHNLSLGHPHAPAPSMLYPASDIDWWFDSYMIVYMFQCHSPKSSHPLPFPLSPKVRYTHLCLFCCLAYRVVIAIFLNSIYMC